MKRGAPISNYVPRNDQIRKSRGPNLHQFPRHANDVIHHVTRTYTYYHYVIGAVKTVQVDHSIAKFSCRFTPKMATQSLLAVPPKATKSVEFSQVFLRFIGNNYDDQPSRYNEAVGEFTTLRESTVVRLPDKHETGLELINR